MGEAALASTSICIHLIGSLLDTSTPQMDAEAGFLPDAQRHQLEYRPPPSSNASSRRFSICLLSNLLLTPASCRAASVRTAKLCPLMPCTRRQVLNRQHRHFSLKSGSASSGRTRNCVRRLDSCGCSASHPCTMSTDQETNGKFILDTRRQIQGLVDTLNRKVVNVASLQRGVSIEHLRCSIPGY